MAPTQLKRLTALQNARKAEIENLGARFRERPADSYNKSMINSRLEELKEIWSAARQTHAEILTRDGIDDDPYLRANVLTQIQDLFLNLRDELLTISEQFEDSVAVPTQQGRISELPGTRWDTAKLPKLDLPKFSGNYEDWESFSDLFISLVHSKTASDATKLSYLKLCLTGTAADLVKDVATTDANYATTWQALKLRFYNPRLIVSNHLNALISMNPLKRESATDLRAFADEAQRIVRALSNLKMPVEYWNVWLVHILSSKLDPESRKLWESELSNKDRLLLAANEDTSQVNPIESNSIRYFPKFTEFADFLEKRSQTLSMIAVEGTTERKVTSSSKPSHGSRRVFHSHQGPKTLPKCALCSKPHQIWKCYKFKNKTAYDRRAEVRRLQLCFNCLGQHKATVCPSKLRCRTCQEKHHSLLHAESRRSQDSMQAGNASDRKPEQNNSATTSVNALTASISRTKYSVILATAQVIVRGPNGGCTRVRALLDQGSEATFISESVTQLLNLPKRPTNISLSGLGASDSGTAKSATSFTLQSKVHPEFQLRTKALVLRRLTSHLPARSITEIDLNQYANLTLADPTFNVRDTIDVILGADVYSQLLRPGLHRTPTSKLIAQNTALGWIISGPIQDNVSRRAARPSPPSVQAFHSISTDDLSAALERFWALQELPDSTPQMKPEEETCERLFRETYVREPDGRYTVSLPLKPNPPAVAKETRRIALGSLSGVHRRFEREPDVAKAYREFMSEYEQLGHMKRIPPAELDNPQAWYLPHHAVLQYSQKGLKKIRVVFDASRLTRDKHCLNKSLMAGPALQRELDLILLNWRRYRYVFTADIVKMFRQIRVAEQDQDYQRILWSPSSLDTPIEYLLSTVTYGTACAPYLAIRTLLQLAQDGKSQFPLGAECLETNTYVDDIFAGADQLPEAIARKTQLTNILRSAGIALDKWAANHIELLPAHLKPCNTERQIDKDSAVKTLGIQWNPGRDSFAFNTTEFKSLTISITKRTILSNIASLFDPLGWLSPITVIAKILMQDLWILKCDWDTPLPSDVRERWIEYCQSLASLSEISIDRWLGGSPRHSYQLHGFSDASSRAYAAAVYLRIDEGNRNVRISLLAAKTKVAPVKTISIPNLELCGAALLVKLIQHLQQAEFLRGLPIYAWSDSQVVLMWLRKHPRFWKTFVANRISYIQTELPSATWSHVPTKENPADLATRGSKPTELANNGLWWHGPAWLATPPANWPPPAENVRTLHARAIADEPDILTRFSSLSRLVRVVAYCSRPLLRIRRRTNNLSPLPPFLTTEKLAKARTMIIKLAQATTFGTEINLLQAVKPLPKRNTLRKLNPILDSDGVLRVGGRLGLSGLSRDSKNPPILPHSSHLSRLFVRQAHHTCLHGGLTLTSSVVSQHVWILGRQKLVKSVINKCITCQRVKPRLAHQLMGDLPATRVTPARPFSIAGLDYAGPIQVRTTKGHGHKSYKGYIVVFVCFATRAIHLEVASDCTSATFIAAFRRFVSRRGMCRKLFSDNATTFHGADRELKEMFNAASTFYRNIATLFANDGTSWEFIPPNAPHYGGLWEAGVKSTKHHLKRTIGDHTLTFEELSTALTEIEACLNSRPLCPLNGELDDLEVLTPAHFLIGDNSRIIPDEDLPDTPEYRLSRYQLLQRIRNNFWKRWSTEYLQHLQERNKWRDPTENFAVGQLVLVMDERYPPAKWPLGRVTDVHAGADGLIRVVTVKTATNALRRHIARLCPLSTEENGKKYI